MMYTQPHPWTGLRKLIHFSLTLAALSLAGPLFGQFVYVTYVDPNDFTAQVHIFGYNVNNTTGALTPIAGSPFDTGGGSANFIALGFRIAPAVVDPTGRFVYVTTVDQTWGFTIDPFSGALTPMPASPFIGSTQGTIAVNPTGRFLYETTPPIFGGGGGNVFGFTIDDASGALTPIAESGFPTGNVPACVAVDPSGKFAYVANYADNSISGYTINAATGALTPIAGSPFAAGASPIFVAVDPAGKFAYVVNANANNVSGYMIQPETGALTPIPGSPFAVTALGPVSLALDPTGTFAYLTALGGPYFTSFRIDATGVLTPIPGTSPFPSSLSATVDSTGRFVYVASTLSGYAINATTGALTPIPGSSFGAPFVSDSIVATPLLSVSVTPSSGGGSSEVFSFRYSDANGYMHLSLVYAGFGPTAYGDEHTCRVEYVRAANKLYLKNDAGTTFLGPVTPGGVGTLSNSQCTLNAGQSSVSGSGNILTLNLALSFKPAFAGQQGIFLYADDQSGRTTPGRQKRGTWDVP